MASVSVVSAAAVALSVMAFAHPGFTTTDVDMHDGGVWVTKLETGQLGHLNHQAQELDSELSLSSTNFDVVQNDGTVLVVDQTNLSLARVDTGQAAFAGQAELPGEVQVTLRGGTVTIMDAVDGRLWALPATNATSFDAEELEPLAVLGSGGAATADAEGGVHAVSAENAIEYSWESTDEGFANTHEEQREELGAAEQLQLTAVGTTPVALDADAGRLLLPGSAHEVPKDAVLQQASDPAANVVLATGSQLITQPLRGGEASVVAHGAGSQAVAPVQANGCVYSAWPSDSRVLRECADAGQSLDEQVDQSLSNKLTFREHRGVVVLNDQSTGISWLMTDELIMVDNWADLIPPMSEEQSDEEDEESAEDRLDNIAPDPTEENNDPIANDDTIFGARIGRSTLVPVLHNDTDPDGDILTVSLVGSPPAGVRISPVRNSSQFQVEIPADYSANSVNFTYEVNDGRGGTDRARVTLQVRDEGQNAAPESLREQSFEVEQRAQYDHMVLDDWYDPDGDDLFLVDARSESGDTVRFNPNGRIVYTATGEPGPTQLTVVVSDGVEETEEVIEVMVRERGTGRPIANADYVSVGVGGITSVEPLANDFLPGGVNARLASASSDGLETRIDRATNTVHIAAGDVGTYFIDYTVAAGPHQSQGHVRVDVVEAVEDARPVAVRDVALLPAGGEALVDLTENDVDPTGGVLVVQSVDVGDAPVSVQLRQRHMLRLEDTHGASGPMTLRYEVSNGAGSATGEIVVIPVAPPVSPRNPVAVDDTATLREGDYTSIAVTDNDFSPDNIPFSVSPELIESSLQPGEGYAFVDGDRVRIHVVEGGPSAVDLTYEIVDDLGNPDTANVRVQVERRDADTNSAPNAQSVTSRVLAGSTVRIPIPLDGIDPNGDGVNLVGWETAPDKGRIVEIGADFFDFEAFPTDSGTTHFDYRVRDRWGAESVNTVTIGIAEPAAVNQNPFAELDEVHVRPGRAVAVDVLANDSDPDGDVLILVGVDTETAPSEVKDLRLGEKTPTVNFTAPEVEGEYLIDYFIEDARGGPARGAIQLRVGEDAPLIPPQPVDDVVAVADLTEDEPFDVDVLANDRDTDGDPSELEVEVLTGPGTVVPGGVQVVPSTEFQIVTYRATDQDGGSGEAFIFVPAVAKPLPYVASDTVVRVRSHEQHDIPLAEVVEMPGGGTARITTPDTVSATNSHDENWVVDEHTLTYISELGYVGDSAISFEVTDGDGPDDPDAVTARLTVPIIVLPSSQVPPTFHGAEITVEPGEAATVLDLKTATRDPDPGDLEEMVFDFVDGGLDGVTADVDGQNFVASAAVDATPGTRGSFGVTATDPAGNSVPGTVVVQVVASTRPMPSATDDTETTDQGVEVTVNATGNDFNPFQNLGEPLEITDVRVVAGEVQAGPTIDAGSISVTPHQDFSGTLRLQYTIQDATQTAERTAVGNVIINVRGRPDTPVRPNVESVGDSQVQLSWVAPSANGAAITGYRVEYNGGSQECGATTCTITELTNDTVYNFEIVAINDVGESDPSPASIDARPDVRPEAPAAPQAARGDQELRVTWERPENRGSAIEFYLLDISPAAPDGTVQQRVEGTSFTWPNLKNGTEYQFRVQAHNRADEPSDFSTYSAGTIPAGKPGEAQNVTASSTMGPSRTQVTVSWGHSFDNGDPVTKYTVVAMRGSEAIETREVPRTENTETMSQTFEELPTSSTPYTFTVVGTNDVGDSPAARSNEVRSLSAPGAPTVTLVRDNPNSTSTIRVAPGALNGYLESELRYEYSISGKWYELPDDQTIHAKPHKDGHSITVRAIGTADGQEARSAASSSLRIAPYDKPPAPGVSGSVESNGVRFTFSYLHTDNLGRPITDWQVQHRINGGSWSGERAYTPGEREFVEAKPGQTVELRARVRAEEGADAGWSDWSSPGSGTMPAPSITLEYGDDAYPGSCNGESGQTCKYYELKWSNLPTGTYTFDCYNTRNSRGTFPKSDKENTWFQGGQVHIDSASGSTQYRDTGDRMCYSGFGGDAWMTISGNGIDLQTPYKPWPAP